MHVAVIGTGRVGRMTLLALAYEHWISKLTLIDTNPGLAYAIGEEIRHSLASTRNVIDISTYEEDEAVQDADIVLVTAGYPRDPDMESRTDLTDQNAKIIQHIAQSVVPKNPGAKYVIVTNPVDAMATLFRKISGAKWVISTGTNLESQRFRAELSKQLNVPITAVAGFAGGEHGQAATFLWSTVRIEGYNLDKYLQKTGKRLDKAELERSVKQISRLIIKASGGTRHGPATSFRDILRSIALDENKVLAIAAPHQTSKIDEPVMVSFPRMVGKDLGPTINEKLKNKEIQKIDKAASEIYKTYKRSLNSIQV